jgi:hypothetical protein
MKWPVIGILQTKSSGGNFETIHQIHGQPSLQNVGERRTKKTGVKTGCC